MPKIIGNRLKKIEKSIKNKWNMIDVSKISIIKWIWFAIKQSLIKTKKNFYNYG